MSKKKKPVVKTITKKVVQKPVVAPKPPPPPPPKQPVEDLGKLVLETEIGGLRIALHQVRKDKFSIVYHQQHNRHLTYYGACQKLGEVILHALSCAGKVDNG